MTPTRTVFVSAQALTWRTVRYTAPGSATDHPVQGPGLGFLAVFETEAEALQAHPGSAVIPLIVPVTWVQHAVAGRARGDA